MGETDENTAILSKISLKPTSVCLVNKQLLKHFTLLLLYKNKIYGLIAPFFAPFFLRHFYNAICILLNSKYFFKVSLQCI